MSSAKKMQSTSQIPRPIKKNPTQPNKPNSNVSNKKVTKRITQNQISNRTPFLKALTSPFDPTVMGIRVPDPFPFPTATYHLHQTTVVGNTYGNGCLAFMPNPTLSIIDIGGINGSVAASVASTPMVRYSSTTTSSAYRFYGSTTPTALATVLADFRVVSWGLKISNLQPELSATGRIIVAMIPLGDTIPSWAELQAATLTSGVVNPIFGSGGTFIGSSSLLNLPTAQEFAVQDLLHGDLEISGMYTNSSFWQFKTLINNPAITSAGVSGDSVTAVFATGINQIIGYKDLTRCHGGASIVIYFEGTPTTAGSNLFQVETIYHLEGSPQLGTDATVPIPSTMMSNSIGSTLAVENSMSAASRMTNVFTWITKGAEFLNNNKDNIIRVATVAGSLMA